MPNHDRRAAFEQELTRLKQARQTGEITVNDYIEQAGNLRFDDKTTGQTWWLDPESEVWYVAPIGSQNFEPCESSQRDQPPEPETERSSPEPEFYSESGTESVSPSSQSESGSASTPSEVQPGPNSSSVWLKIVLIGIGGVIIMALLCAVIWLLLPASNKTIPTPMVVVNQISPTPSVAPQPTDTPTTIPSPTSLPTVTFTLVPLPSATATPYPTFTTSPTATNTPTPSVTATPSPTFTTSPTATNTLTPSAIATSLPVTGTPTMTPEPMFSGKFAYPEYFIDPEERGKNTFNVKVIDLSTGQEIALIPRASQPALSPDGTKLAYISWSDLQGLYSISLVDETVNAISIDAYSQRPQWSFDNQGKVFEFIKNDQKEIHFSDEDNSGLPGIQTGQTPVWTPDGRLVVTACRSVDCGLAVVNTNGTDLRFLTHSTEDISPAVSPNGQCVAYTSNQNGNWDVWLVDLLGGTPVRLTTSPNREGIPTWSPDGQWIAFASESDGNWTVQVISPDGTGQQKLPLKISGSLDGRILREDYRQLGWLHENISWSR